MDDWKQIMEEYKDNEKGFIYLDPPYVNSYNESYKNYDNKNECKIKDD